jgi:hypothetical protein
MKALVHHESGVNKGDITTYLIQIQKMIALTNKFVYNH